MEPSFRRAPLVFAALTALLLFTTPPCSAGTAVVFSTDFSSGLPSQFSAPGCVIEGVQGYAGLGPTGRKFSGTFLRYTSTGIQPTTLTLRGLPPHDHLSVRFLLGLIDSWDGTELMRVSVDGTLKFNHWFQLATGDTTDYFPAPPGAILSMGTNLGFSGSGFYNRDRAYDLGAEPAFLNIAHTADSVVVAWTLGAVSGGAASQWQGGGDESWAIDAVSVEISGPTLDAGEGRSVGLALRALSNPSRDGRVRLQFSLPEPAPARVELLDVAGRRQVERDLATGSTGWQELDLASGRRLGPGLYFVRLKQRDQQCTARVIVAD